MADDASTIRLKIDGEEYEIDPQDLDLGEMELVEEESGQLFDDVNWASAKGILLLTYIALHRRDNSVTLDDCRKIKVRQFEQATDVADEAESNGVQRPTKPAAGGSRRGKSGATSSKPA